MTMWTLGLLVAAVGVAAAWVVVTARSGWVAVAAFTVALLVGFLTPPAGELLAAARTVAAIL